MTIAQDRAAKRAVAADDAGRHSDLEFVERGSNEVGRSSVENSNGRAADNSESERDPPTGSIIKGGTTHDM